VLSYQHTYHAGNFADVHKHVVLLRLLHALQAKPAPLCYVDGHAGCGLYDLRSDKARKTAEYVAGVQKLWHAKNLPPVLSDYIACLRDFNGSAELTTYPGSPALVGAQLRESDRAVLLELHPKESRALREHFKGNRRIAVHLRDSYEGLPALLPPAIPRGLVLLDPSYEVKTEYGGIVKLLQAAHRRWPTAVYLLWYPLLREARHRFLLKEMQRSGIRNVLHSQLIFDSITSGIYGSGLLIVSPPWQSEADIKEAGNQLAKLLVDGNGEHSLKWLIPE
jgi:23S rRNA (adenine2030-N6)-methyltransferase